MRLPSLLLLGAAGCSQADVPDPESQTIVVPAPKEPKRCTRESHFDQHSIAAPVRLGITMNQEVANAALTNDRRFRELQRLWLEEASLDLRLVEKAGGYCNLPANERLSDELDLYRSEAAELAARYGVSLNWQVELGQGHCDPISPEEIFKVASYADPVLLKEAANMFNTACELSQGGVLPSHQYSDFMLEDALITRGRAVWTTLPEEEQSVRFLTWQGQCAQELSQANPDRVEAASFEALPKIEQDYFLGSTVLASAGLGGDEARWLCEEGRNFVRHPRTECGVVTYPCLPEKE